MEIENLLVSARHLSEKDTFSEADVATLDALLALMYSGAGGRVSSFFLQKMEEVNGILEALKANNSSMDLVPLVMETGCTAEAKFFALQILDDQVKVGPLKFRHRPDGR